MGVPGLSESGAPIYINHQARLANGFLTPGLNGSNRSRPLHHIHMSTKAKIILVYFAIALVFAIYGATFGDYAYKGFAYNLGAAVVWPVMIFPGLGKIIGVIVLIVALAFVWLS